MSENKKFELSPSISIIIAGVIIAGSIVYVNTNPAAPSAVGQAPAPSTATNVRAPSAQDHLIGSLTAPLVLIEYSDFQCPFCNVVHPTLKRIVDESNGQIAWVYRHLPLESLHPNARPAALASECVAEQLGNDGFWKFAGIIFADQSKMSADYYVQVAVQLGADKTKFNSCVSSNKYASRVDADSQEAQANGGNGTPYTVLYKKGQTASPARCRTTCLSL
jgi:protein-disulfide isomerase